jgi:hypothetical protein
LSKRKYTLLLSLKAADSSPTIKGNFIVIWCQHFCYTIYRLKFKQIFMRPEHSIIKTETLPVMCDWRHRGSRCIALLVINLDPGWEVDVKATLWPIYPRERSPIRTVQVVL